MKRASLAERVFTRVRITLLIAIFGVGCASAGLAAEVRTLRPNIILILADDLGYSDLGCFGSEIPTPNLDRLASRGIRMTQFYTTPRCCPTRASLLTGLYPHQAGVGNMMEDRGIPGYRGELNRDCITAAEELRLAGYRTAMVGKWHLNHIHFDAKKQLDHESDVPFWESKEGWPMQRGFEDYYGTIHGVCSYYDPFSLVKGNTPIQPETKDFYYTDIEWRKRPASVRQIETATPGFYYTDAISDRAVADIDNYAGGDKPLFLYVAYTAPHWPLQAPERDIARHRQAYRVGWDVIRTNRYKRQIELGIIDKSWGLSPRDPRVPEWSNVLDKEWEANRMATYAAMVERMDHGVGRILDRLKEKGIEQNTLVLFLSDNGACAEVLDPRWYDIPSRTRSGQRIKVGNSDHRVFAGPEDVWQSYGVPWANVSDTPFLRYKHFTYEGGISTPLIASWPERIRPGSISRELGHITDILATFVDVAGAKHPQSYAGRPILPLEGQSLLRVFQGRARSHPTPIFWEHEGNRAMREDRWKLVSLDRQPWELYDLELDRTELNNLATRLPEKVKEMSTSYEAWAKRCNVVPPEKLPPARPTVPAGTDAGG